MCINFFVGPSPTPRSAGRRISFGGGANYTASKVASSALPATPPMSWRPTNGVQAVVPPFGGGQVPSAERKAERGEKIPLGRMVVLFLASERSRCAPASPSMSMAVS